MRKALRIVAVSTGVVSLVSSTVLGCIYVKDIAGHLKKIRTKITNKINYGTE